MSYILEAVKKAEYARGNYRLSEDSITPNDTTNNIKASKPWLVIAIFLNAIVLLLWLIFYFDLIPNSSSKDNNKVTLESDDRTQHSQVSSDDNLPSFLAKPINQSDKQLSDNDTHQDADVSHSVRIDEYIADNQIALDAKEAIKDAVDSEEKAVVSTSSIDTKLAKIEPLPFETEIPDVAAEGTNQTTKEETRQEKSALSNVTINKHADVPSLNELPYSVQKEIPKIAISVHIYNAQQDARKVRVNGRLYHEGQTVNENLLIEEITSYGVVFNYQDTLFKVNLY